MLPLTPTKLGRYEIVEEIGKGAMGVVYLAKDPLIGRLVALKTFRIGYSVKDDEMEQFRVRFIREAQSAGILAIPTSSPSTTWWSRPRRASAFIAMEYVEGHEPQGSCSRREAASAGTWWRTSSRRSPGARLRPLAG